VTQTIKREPQAAGQGEWMIRQRNGSVFRFKELTTLQKWIVERKVARDDEISKTGQTWKRLGNIAELATFFQVLEAPRGNSLESEFTDELDDDDDLLPPKSNNVAIALVLVGLASAVFAASFFMRDRIAALFAPAPAAVQDNSDSLDVAAGLRSYKRNTDSGFRAAETLFDKAAQQGPNAEVLAGAALNQIAWAEVYHEAAQALDHTIKDAAAGKASLSVAEVAQKAQQLAQAQADDAARTQRAVDLIKRASEIDARSAGVTRANARLLALRGERAQLLPLVERVQNTSLANDEEILYALAMTDIAAPDTQEHAASLAQKIVDADPDYIAARYALAWIAVQKNDARAATLIDEILHRVPDHTRALQLKSTLAQAASAPASAPSTPPAAPTKDAGKESFEQLLLHAHQLREHEHSKQAIDIYDRALALRPNDAEALTGLGFCFLDLEDNDSAIGEFSKAVRSNSRFSDAYMGLAEAFRARNQKRDAVKNYQKYLDITPDGQDAEVARRALKDLGQGE
jgi:tetratricopeptide (TPR) repeat protein